MFSTKPIRRAEGIDEADDGSAELLEVSHFDSSYCIMFKEAK